jgi:hypothetical protein
MTLAGTPWPPPRALNGWMDGNLLQRDLTHFKVNEHRERERVIGAKFLTFHVHGLGLKMSDGSKN